MLPCGLGSAFLLFDPLRFLSDFLFEDGDLPLALTDLSFELLDEVTAARDHTLGFPGGHVGLGRACKPTHLVLKVSLLRPGLTHEILSHLALDDGAGRRGRLGIIGAEAFGFQSGG